MKLLYGKETYLIEREVAEIIQGIEEVKKYSSNDTLEDIINELSAISLFSEKKFTIIEEHSVFKKEEESKVLLEEIIGKPELRDELIFIAGDSLPKKNALVAWLLKNADVKEFKQIKSSQLPSFIHKEVELKGGQISNKASITLAGKLPIDLRIVVNEIQKLLLESNNITEGMVSQSVSNYLEDEAFALSNAIVDRSAKNIISSYSDLVARGEPATNIISRIAYILNFTLTISSYRRSGLSSQEIADEMGIHKFRVTKSSELINKTSDKDLKSLIVALADLDTDIKSGKVDDMIGLNHFLLKLIK